MSRGSSVFLAVVCMMAVRKDCGLKKPESQKEHGSMKSEVQPCSSLILSRRSAYQAVRPEWRVKTSGVQRVQNKVI